MTCIEKLREMHPEWDEEHISEVCAYDCVEEHGIKVGPCVGNMCDWCWNREIPETRKADPIINAFAAAVERVENEEKQADIPVTPEIPWEFEYESKYVIENENGEPEERSERVWVHILESWEKQRYTRKPCYRIRFEQECGIMWEGWCTEADVLEMLEKRV